jgi:hypothetical protein
VETVKRIFALTLVTLSLVALTADAARVTRTTTRTRGGKVTRTRVTVRTVRPTPVVRIAPRTYLGAVAFTAVAVATLPPARNWSGREKLDREEGWTDFTMNVDARGTKLLLEVEEGPAQISFAEVVFENGEAQVVDFDDRVQTRGVYSLLDFRDGRKVDHVRIVAKAQREQTEIKLHLV